MKDWLNVDSFLNFLWGMETNLWAFRVLDLPLFLNFLWGMETCAGSRPLSQNPRFWTSYEGWKPYSPSNTSTIVGTFLNFLWGMETQTSFSTSRPCPLRFWTSYEGWKHIDKFHYARLTLVFELPMRDGNEVIACWPTSLSLVFELPMRDGNGQGQIHDRLKASVFELPMRDGNASCSFFRTSSVTFLNFLWGMETANIRCASWFRRWFLNFLWGMETRLRLLLSRQGHRFWTSYEGWKLVYLWCFIDNTLVFELPMRDGNSCNLRKVKKRLCVFELPMRDGNLLAPPLADLRWFVFELPMRDGNYSILV